MTPPRDAGLARARPERRTRDPLGKSALFSGTGEERPPLPYDAGQDARGASHLFSGNDARPGTLIVDCSACHRQTRVGYAEFAVLHFPFWAWMPAPTRTHRHWLRCPACHRFAWLRAGWLE